MRQHQAACGWFASFSVLVLAVAVAGSAGQGAPSRSVTLQELTVPAGRLPSDCSVKTLQPGRQERTALGPGQERVLFIGSTPSIQPPEVLANPWIGTDRRTLAWIRQRVDGVRRVLLPDAPPLTASEQVSFMDQYANGVEEGYAATYVQVGPRDVDLGVSAVRFATPHEEILDFPGTTQTTPLVRMDIGVIRVALFADAGPCANAIEAYLRSLTK